MAVVSSNGRARGMELLEELVILVDLHYPAEAPPAACVGHSAPAYAPAPRRDVPYYDARRRQLWYNGKPVKRLVQPSANQEAILMAFQEEGWPDEGIFDPLRPNGDTQPAKRLRDTLAALNGHHQTPGVLRFGSDGTGQGVRWLLGGR
ncbi:MAG TPA: hypothetical protein VFW87_09765 [Pirellulales bacterium]|nr:hypothetical protein [Pirellulales bacterium]